MDTTVPSFVIGYHSSSSRLSVNCCSKYLRCESDTVHMFMLVQPELCKTFHLMRVLQLGGIRLCRHMISVQEVGIAFV